MEALAGPQFVAPGADADPAYPEYPVQQMGGDVTVLIRSLGTDSSLVLTRPRRRKTRSLVIRYLVVAQWIRPVTTAATAASRPHSSPPGP